MENNNLKYNEIDIYLFDKINGFKDFFFSEGYSIEYVKLKYIVMGELCNFIKNNFIDIEYNIIGNSNELNYIIDVIYYLYNNGDDKIKELIIIGFIEGLLPAIEYIDKFKNILKYGEFQEKSLEIINFWKG